jgi:hypothetical protein
MHIRLIDDDQGTLRALDGPREVKSWTYTRDTRHAVYRRAREFCDGWRAALTTYPPVVEVS